MGLFKLFLRQTVTILDFPEVLHFSKASYLAGRQRGSRKERSINFRSDSGLKVSFAI